MANFLLLNPDLFLGVSGPAQKAVLVHFLGRGIMPYFLPFFFQLFFFLTTGISVLKIIRKGAGVSKGVRV